jgi:hypothetical protein
MIYSRALVWKVNLAWSQKFAAYWSISWPAFLAAFWLMIWLTRSWSLDDMRRHVTVLSLTAILVFYGIQAVLTHRLVRKNYMSFCLEVVRDHGERSRRLTLPEGGRL